MRNPSDLYLLRLAAGSILGVLTNVDEVGAPAMAFHGDPKLMTFDPASGDYGLAFYGHSHNTQSFLVPHKDFGWLCYFCDVEHGQTYLRVFPRDSYHRTVYLASLGLQIQSEVGTIFAVEMRRSAQVAAQVTVTFDIIGSQPLTKFRLRLACRDTTTGACARGLHTYVVDGVKKTRGAYEIVPAANGNTNVTITRADWL